MLVSIHLSFLFHYVSRYDIQWMLMASYQNWIITFYIYDPEIKMESNMGPIFKGSISSLFIAYITEKEFYYSAVI